MNAARYNLAGGKFYLVCYIPTRYPNGLPDSIPARVYAQKDALAALQAAEQVVAFVRQRL